MTTNSTLAGLVWDVCETPLGPLTLEASADGLAAISFPGRGGPRRWDRRDPVALDPAATALEAYFAGERQSFADLTLDLSASLFDVAVWTALLDIPYGETATYGEVAHAVGRPDIVRGVGAAIGRNPLAIVVPCHRVIGADGSLTGYRGGLQRKQALLDLERRVTTGLEPEPAWAFRQLALL
jgi:methylated-DNA-[protein]-cysteine S-methyltransferase